MVSDLDPADSWSVGEEAEGAPAAFDAALLVDARRATGEAQSQTGFLISGTKELLSGVDEIHSKKDQVTGPVAAARDGSRQLNEGLVQLQAATGQLGAGATKVADGVGQAVDQIVGLNAVRGQILGVIDRTLEDWKDTKDPEKKQLREQLVGFREQVATFELDENMRAQLLELRDGSREIANQLHTPGYAYHDGIYTATKGSKELADGLAQLDAGVGEAMQGLDQLHAGATKIDDMAKTTKQRVGAIQRALPVAQAGTTEAQEAGITKTLPPLFAFFIAASLLLGAGLRSREQAWLSGFAAVILAGIAAGLFSIAAHGVIAADIALVAGIALVFVVATLLTSSVMTKVFGARVGAAVSMVGAAIQIAVSGWAWHAASTSVAGSLWWAVSALMPVHYFTAAMVAAGNAGGTQSLIVSLVVLAGMTVMGLVALMVLDRGRKTYVPQVSVTQ